MQAGTYEFKVGDKAIYPKQGVTEVVSIEERKIGTATMEFYVLKPLDAKNNDRIRVAVAQATLPTRRSAWRSVPGTGRGLRCDRTRRRS